MPDRITVPGLIKMKQRGEKIVVVTCYDYPSARLLDAAGVDIIFIGDSLGDNVLGYPNTIPVTIEEMLHHAKAVRRGTERAIFFSSSQPFVTRSRSLASRAFCCFNARFSFSNLPTRSWVSARSLATPLVGLRRRGITAKILSRGAPE